MKRIGDLERAYVEEVLASEFRTSHGGRMAAALESAFAHMIGVRYAISFINGTATMHAGLHAARIGPGDEVIVPPLTMASTTFAVLQAGAVPIFADINPETLQIDPESIRDRLTEFTRAVIPVALYGLAPELDEIVAIAAERDLLVLEDDAQAIMSTYRGRPVGAIGDMASFSFQSSKHLTSGEGGMLVTDDEELALAVRRFNSLGYAAVGAAKGAISRDDIQSPDYPRHVAMGFNYRMPEVCAAIMRAQLERREELVNCRIEAARLFTDAIGDCEWLRPQRVPEYAVHSYWTFAVTLDHPTVAWPRFRETFLSHGGDPFYGAWKPTYLEPLFDEGCPVQHPAYRGGYQRYGSGLCPTAERIQPRLVQLKTDYWDRAAAENQAEALQKTISALD